MSSFSEPRRPRLLPQNRKLRHLKGLSLRNLSFAPTQLRAADDVNLNISPHKLGALRESGQLHSSRSSESMRQDSLRPDILRLERPRPQTRRTSLSLAHASPALRQKQLESLVDDVSGDAFFSLHANSAEEPVYVSEVRERSANFNFQFFELANKGPPISRACRVLVRIWAKRPKQASWSFVLEELVDLRELKFIGTLVDRKYPPNALVFHLEDGPYSLDFPNRESKPKHASPITTSSYKALMKLANLERSIEDAMETQQKIMEQMNEILDKSTTNAPDAAEEEVALAERYVVTQRRANRLAEKRRDELRESLRSRRAAIDSGRELQAKTEEDIENNREKLHTSTELLEKTQQQIRGQRRRICSELADIFPITPLLNAPPLSFQICNMPLSNSEYDSSAARSLNEDVLSAGLGLVALLTRNLQLYLSHPLPYALHHYGSRSYARDDISQLSDKQVSRREFPLYLPRGGSTAGQWRFQYGWFLLNKDIEALCASQGLKVVDIRHSLPNLKYLLYVCSAGTQDVPARKKGGVRGLWASKLKGSLPAVPSLADGESNGAVGGRRDSIDADPVRNADVKSDGNGVAGDAASGTWSSDTELGLPFGGVDAKFTLRTKGLREHVTK